MTKPFEIIKFPLEGEKLDFVAYYGMKQEEQEAARQWLQVNGSPKQKRQWQEEFDRFTKQNAERDQKEEAHRKMLAANSEAPNKHGQTPKPGKRGGGCSIS